MGQGPQRRDRRLQSRLEAPRQSRWPASQPDDAQTRQARLRHRLPRRRRNQRHDRQSQTRWSASAGAKAMNDVTPNDVQIKLAEAEALIADLIAALEPFAKKARAFDWRKGSIYKTFEGEPFPDDEAKVMLD